VFVKKATFDVPCVLFVLKLSSSCKILISDLEFSFPRCELSIKSVGLYRVELGDKVSGIVMFNLGAVWLLFSL